MSEYHWWNCGLVVYVASPAANVITERRVRRPGRSWRKFGVDALRIGMWGPIFDGKTGPDSNVFGTMSEAAEFMATHYANKRQEEQDERRKDIYEIREGEWRATAARARAKEAKVKA